MEKLVLILAAGVRAEYCHDYRSDGFRVHRGSSATINIDILIAVWAEVVVEVLTGTLAGAFTGVLPSIGVGKLPDIDLWSVFGAAITALEFTLTVSPEE